MDNTVGFIVQSYTTEGWWIIQWALLFRVVHHRRRVAHSAVHLRHVMAPSLFEYCFPFYSDRIYWSRVINYKEIPVRLLYG